jgi:transposase InsO family protein
VSRARLVITAITTQGLSQAEAARTFGLSEAWVSRLMARWRREGEAAFEPRSRRPKTSPNATGSDVVELIVTLREQLSQAGHDAGADTVRWHLEHHHQITIARATVHRILTRAGTVTPEPKKRPKSSYIRFEAAMPNECWQSDFTHYPLTDTATFPHGVEIITWLDDCTRYALHITAHARITGPIVLATFRETAGQHGIPASTLTDNGMVYTTRHSGGRGGRNGFEHQLRTWNVAQKNTRPNHPTTTGKVERFQQTLKKWLRAQPTQPATIAELQQLLDRFRDDYNQRRPHHSLPHRATPAARYEALPKATPGESRDPDTHDRVRHDRISKAGNVTLRVGGQLRHIAIGRTYARTFVILLIQDLEVRIIHATTGELLRELTIDLDRDYQPRKPQDPNPHPQVRVLPMS